MTEHAQRPSLKPDLPDVLRRTSGLPDRIRKWRGRRRSSPAWTATVAGLLFVMLLPVTAILVIAATPAESVWPHLLRTVLPNALANTLLLAAGTGLVTLIAGTAAAWLVTMYRFPGRSLVDRLLVLPLAMPTYIVAYCYADLLDYAGPVQTALRSQMGWHSVRDYWFPDMRSLPGAVVIISSVLYPYVYLTARASFVQQSVCALEVARTLGRTPLGAFWSVALPLSRPALAAGVALVLMEGFNDLGAVQHLGVETLSASIYATWLQRSNLAGAAQLATVMLSMIVLLFIAERILRSQAPLHHTTGRYRAIPFQDLQGWRAALALMACALPFAVGFFIPVLVLVPNAIRHAHQALSGGLFRAAANSLMLSGLAAIATVIVGLILSYARRVAPNGFTRPAVAAAGLGYALPGTVLAIGLLVPLAALDNRIDTLLRAWLGISSGLLLSGSLFALVLAYTIRFLAAAVGSIDAGLERISPNLDAAARALGETALSTLWRVHVPLLLPALGAGALLVFVDAMKELPATLLLRPFNFETLATSVYGHAALEQFEQAALGSLLIVITGLLPVVLMHRALAEGRAGGG